MQYHGQGIVISLLLGGALFVAVAQEAPAPEDRLISQEQLLERSSPGQEPVVVLDVRTAAEFATAHVPGARNLPHEQIGARIGELEELRERDLVVYCRSGRRTQLALDVLRAHGFTRLWHLDGDFLAWEAQGQPIESE